jgi:short-subunit dehydrogenase
MSKTALITGATSGIGKATAEILAKKTIIKLSFRREDRMVELEKNFQN